MQSFEDIKRQLPAKVLKSAQAKTKKMLAELPLQELRHARQLSQEQLAEVLNIKQSSVSKLERRTDMYISTLRNFVHAMGGKLEINAVFPEGIVKIEQFHHISRDDETRV